MWIKKERYENIVSNAYEAEKDMAKTARGYNARGVEIKELEKEIAKLRMRLLESKRYVVVGVETKTRWLIKAVGYERSGGWSAGDGTRFFDSDNKTVFEASEGVDIHVDPAYAKNTNT